MGLFLWFELTNSDNIMYLSHQPRADPGFEVRGGANMDWKIWKKRGTGVLWIYFKHTIIIVYIFQLLYTSNTIFFTILYILSPFIQYFIKKSYLKNFGAILFKLSKQALYSVSDACVSVWPMRETILTEREFDASQAWCAPKNKKTYLSYLWEIICPVEQFKITHDGSLITYFSGILFDKNMLVGTTHLRLRSQNMMSAWRVLGHLLLKSIN